MHVFYLPSIIKKYLSLLKNGNNENNHVFDVKYTTAYTYQLYH